MRAAQILVGGVLITLGSGAMSQEATAPGVEFVFAETVTLGKVVEVGKTVRGERRIIPITGGHFEGPQIKGEVMPGGWDWQLTRADGCTDVKADYFLKTDDGVVIIVVNTGEICPGEKGAPAAVRTHPVFEPPLGKYEWLGKQAFIGTLGMAPAKEGPAVLIRFYRVN
jgi:hypothetical protein